MPSPFATGPVPKSYSSIVAVAPSDTVNLASPASGLMATAAGNAAIVTLQGQSVTVPLAAGVLFPIGATRVNATGTTATGLLAFS